VPLSCFSQVLELIVFSACKHGIVLIRLFLSLSEPAESQAADFCYQLLVDISVDVIAHAIVGPCFLFGSFPSSFQSRFDEGVVT
jgi:hypothetical protein